jgi:hypothetical protein
MEKVKVISYGKGQRSAEIVVRHSVGNGKFTSVTRHIHHIGHGIYEDVNDRKYKL